MTEHDLSRRDMRLETGRQRRGMEDRRSGLPRRSDEDRRADDRRLPGTGSHRWTGRSRRATDRRSGGRRSLFDRRRARRRDSLSPLTADEVDRVRRMFTTPDVTRICPVCRAGFSLGPPRIKNGATVRRVSCRGCGRATSVTDSIPGRILVVEPVEAARASVRPMLVAAGHEVSEAEDVEEGLAAYRTTPSDVVIVDVSTRPDFDGSRFISRLLDEFPTAAVVALSRRVSYGVGDRTSVASYLGAVTVRRMPCSRAEMQDSVEIARAARV